MFTTKQILLNDDLGKKIDLLDEEQIYRYYLPDLKLGKRINSPFREDRDPSFSIFVGHKGKIIYHDFKTGETGNVIQFVMKLFALSYVNAMRRIVLDSTKGSNIIQTKKERTVCVQHKKEIKVIAKDFTPTDLLFWESYGILKRTLTAYRVYALAAVFIDGVLVAEYKNSQPVYGYYLGNGNWKIYKPFSQQRFYTNTNILQGYNQLPENGDLLIITKSLKDVMTLSELGYNAVAPHSESVKIIPEYEELKARFKRIVLFFDNDEPGTMGAISLSKSLGIPYILLPTNQNCKDISDFYKANGFEASKLISEDLLCQLNA